MVSVYPVSVYPVSVYPVSVYPVSVYPVSVYPVSVYPVSVYPVSVYPVSVYPVSGTRLFYHAGWLIHYLKCLYHSGDLYGFGKSTKIEITSWLVSAYDFYSRVVKDR